MNTRLFLLILAMAFCFQSNAQIQLKGFVYTKDLVPIHGASVLLHSLSDSSRPLVTFTVSDNHGFYSLNIRPDSSYLITIRALSYQGIKEKLLFSRDSLIINKNFVLSPSVSFLDTVKVNLKYSLSKTGDTLTFHPDAFALNNETNIEQLISRLPGMEITEGGKISFNGKPISGVLIDGDDLFKKNYQQLTQNAAPKIVDRIQVIKNYQKDALLKEFNKGGTQVINLKLKDKFRNYLFGNGTIGYGTNDNKMGDIFLIKLSPQTKIQAGGNYNTIGSSFATSNEFKPEDFFSETQFFSYTPASPFLNVGYYYFPNIPLYYQQKNKSIQGYTNAMFRKKGWESILNAKYAIDHLRQNQSNHALFNDGTKLFSDDDGTVRNQLQEYNLTSSKVSKNESIYINTSLKDKRRKYQLHTASNHSLETLQRLNDNDLMWQLNFSYNKKLKEGILWSNTVGYFNQNIHGNLQTDPDFLFWLFPDDLSLNHLESTAQYQLSYTKLKSGLSFGNSRLRSELDLSFASENRFFISVLNTKRLIDDSTGIPFQNNNSFHIRYFSGQYKGSLFLSSGSRLTFSALTEPHFLNYIGENTNTEKLRVFYDYSLGITSKIRTSDFNFNIGVKKQLPGNDRFFPGFIQQSFHELQSGMVDLQGERSTYLQLRHSLMSVKRGLMLFVALNLSHDKSNIISDLNTNGIASIRSSLFYPHTTNRLTLFFNSQKTLGDLPFHLKSNIIYMRSSLVYGFNNIITESDLQNVNASLGIKSHTDLVINGDYTFYVLYSKNKIKEPGKRTLSTGTILNKLNLYLTPKKLFNTTITMNSIASRKLSFEAVFMDCSINRKFMKDKFLVEIFARNLLDKDIIRKQIISPFSIQENSTRLRGAEIFLKLRYELR